MTREEQEAVRRDVRRSYLSDTVETCIDHLAKQGPFPMPEPAQTLCTKKGFRLLKTARTRANEIASGVRRNKRGRPKSLRVYLCYRCGLYHLTRQEKRNDS